MKPTYDDTRQHLLDTGNRIMAGKGFSGVGLNEILQTAGVPKGSFYHYFKSKEQFGQALLEDYFRRYLAEMDQRFATAGQSGRERLMDYWQCWLDIACTPGDDRRCLVVKLSAEVADLSEAMRITLRDGADQIVGRIADCLEQGQADGSLPALNTHDTANALYQLWLGASLLAKLQRDTRPLEQALATTAMLLGV